MSPTPTACACTVHALQRSALQGRLGPTAHSTRPYTHHTTRSANAEACDLLKKKGEAAYNERVRRFAADYPKLLLQLKATEAKK